MTIRLKVINLIRMSKNVKYLINIEHFLPRQRVGSSSDAVAIKQCLSQTMAKECYKILTE